MGFHPKPLQRERGLLALDPARGRGPLTRVLVRPRCGRTNREGYLGACLLVLLLRSGCALARRPREWRGTYTRMHDAPALCANVREIHIERNAGRELRWRQSRCWSAASMSIVQRFYANIVF